MISALWNKITGRETVSVPVVVEETMPTEDLINVEVSPALFSKVVTKDVPEDAPEFKRVYTAIVCGDIELEITIKNGWFAWSKPREISGYLKQPNRGYVSFDPENIAEKVIMPDVFEATEAFIGHAKQLDDEYVKTLDRFVDDKGRTWGLLKETKN